MGDRQHQAQIEHARKELHTLALEHGIQHPRVLSQSVKLDALINEYFDCKAVDDDKHPERDS
ncbi:aspartyl-phosphate phosphatase Spo0E family protein [Paenibacillus sp. sgz5001063]|uniref:aspartyl-phosphate phosphatase Spo0E family protein n=1 Tax=Paenibacillus sp. sgz5001063 TaxID=3242474 RepID=UPI0036D3251D